MASSQRTLDLDTLTYKDLYLKARSTEQISSYTIPVIPGGSNVYKLFKYFTPEQVLSTANLTFTPSTIPGIINAITKLSTNQLSVAISLSSVSDLVGGQISSVQSTATGFYNFQLSTLYYSSYTQLVNGVNILQGQNIQILNLQGNIINLGNSISTLSTQLNPNFDIVNATLENIFNQGESVSSISTYFVNYYINLSTSIQNYSTNIGETISSVITNDASTMTGYTIETYNNIQNASGSAVSSLSTIVGSTLEGFNLNIISYNPTVGLNNISTFVDDSISSLSSFYIIQAGIAGICTMSTTLNKQYRSSILQAQNLAGTPGLCTMSTYLTNIFRQISSGVALASGPTVSTFSTLLQDEINLINNAICTVGFSYLILQQEAVSVSISSLSTSFGNDNEILNSLENFTTMLPTVYSTLSTFIDLQSPFVTLQTLSTSQASNYSTINKYMSTVYPKIFSGPGLSSLSSFINPNFSSISTTLTTLFSSFSNSIYAISSLRTDPGVSTLSSFVNSNLTPFYSSFTILNQSVNMISHQSVSTISLYYLLSTNDSLTYSNLNPAEAIDNLNNIVIAFSNYNDGQYLNLTEQTSNVSTFASSFTHNIVSSYTGVENKFFTTLNYLVSSYTSVSTVSEQNIYSPTFSTFTTNSINTSNLIINTGIYASSIGILASTTTAYPFSMMGGANFINSADPSINHILVGATIPPGRTTFLNTSNANSFMNSPSDPGFTVEANDIAYNGSIWVIVGNSTGSRIKYSVNPMLGWSNASILASGTFAINTVKWSGSYWLAGTSGLYDLLQSSDGKIWTAVVKATRMDEINDLAWNGQHWSAVGINSAYYPFNNILFTDLTGSWQPASNTFTGRGNAIAANGRTWVAVGTVATNGDARMKYSFNTSNWTDVTLPQLSTALAVTWNGDKFLAGGSNGNSSNLMQSYNGITWTYVQTPTGIDSINAITWDGNQWNAAGKAGALNKIIVSPDAINWTTITTGVTTNKINAIGYSSNTTPTIRLSNFDIFSGNIPIFMNSRHRMNIIQSTIYFNDGSLTIRKQENPNESLGNIGINTTYPEYALDIGVGNARKPIGTNWVTASDSRVKSDVQTVDLLSCAKLVSEIPLRTYEFKPEFKEKTGVPSNRYYGFIAQEVKEVLPLSVSYSKEHGLDDFHSLDTDQIFKLEFGATQYLLSAIEKLDAQVSTLEARHL